MLFCITLYVIINVNVPVHPLLYFAYIPWVANHDNSYVLGSLCMECLFHWYTICSLNYL